MVVLEEVALTFGCLLGQFLAMCPCHKQWKQQPCSQYCFFSSFIKALRIVALMSITSGSHCANLCGPFLIPSALPWFCPFYTKVRNGFPLVTSVALSSCSCFSDKCSGVSGQPRPSHQRSVGQRLGYSCSSVLQGVPWQIFIVFLVCQGCAFPCMQAVGIGQCRSLHSCPSS